MFREFGQYFYNKSATTACNTYNWIQYYFVSQFLICVPKDLEFLNSICANEGLILIVLCAYLAGGISMLLNQI